ncbi:MAG: hypothetical protein JST39_19835 [Bacteroidetes bacterium]|nr:hypothetical protein [Bacteroidota bacterium]
MLKKDDIRLGLVLGFIAPILGMVIYYFIGFYSHHVTFPEYLGYLRQYKHVLTGVSSISLVANAILFTFYVNARKDKTIKGIFLATVIYGIAVLLIKLVA